MIKSLSRTALWYVPNDRRVLYKGFGYIGRASNLPHASLALPSDASLEQVNAFICADLLACAHTMAPVLGEILSKMEEVNPGILGSTSSVVHD